MKIVSEVGGSIAGDLGVPGFMGSYWDRPLCHTELLCWPFPFSRIFSLHTWGSER